MTGRGEGEWPIPALCEWVQLVALALAILLAGYMFGQWIRVLGS